jgi:cytochrome b561
MQEPETGYSTLQIVLHWLIAALVLFQLIFGESMEELMEALEEGGHASAADQALGLAHYWAGLAILALVAIRLVARVLQGTPAPVNAPAGWMHQAARASHALFYLLLLATPIVGLMSYYLGEPWGDIHAAAKPIFIVLIAVHALAALYHQFWLRDGTLKRMLAPVR